MNSPVSPTKEDRWPIKFTSINASARSPVKSRARSPVKNAPPAPVQSPVEAPTAPVPSPVNAPTAPVPSPVNSPVPSPVKAPFVELGPPITKSALKADPSSYTILKVTPTNSASDDEGSDFEFPRNPDEISLGSSEDAERAGPISDPQQLFVEEVYGHKGLAVLPDATSSPSSRSPARKSRRGLGSNASSRTSSPAAPAGMPSQPLVAANSPRKRAATTEKAGKTKTTSGAAKAATGSGSRGVKKKTATTKKAGETKTTSGTAKVATDSGSRGVKEKTATKREVKAALETVRNTRSKRKQAELSADALDDLLKRQRWEKKKGS
ncbi:hypothetical protein MMC07_001284 [Pseudocyphellaria aurata]|nr:hypothetical protein [Pseudocyphellaria aurata]